MVELDGAVSTVTGAASGIGRATALALAAAGSDVVVADINGPGAEATATDIQASGRRALPLRVDVGKREEVEALVERSIAWQGRCDVFISNAGVGCFGNPHEFTAEEWEYMLNVNLLSAIWPLRSIVPHMIDRGSGHLVVVSSGAGFEGFADRAPYNVAKFGIVGLAEALARFLKPTGIGVSLVVPGAVATNGWKIYLFAGADGMEPDEIERRHVEVREQGATWPQPEVMGDLIVTGIREGRYCIVQHNPHEPDWFANMLTKKGRDPDGFVLG